MNSWRDTILQHFANPIYRITLVADPDGLLLEEQLLAAIRSRGFNLLPFDDVVSFRYMYETNYRQLWDDNQPSNLVVILRSSEASLQSLPYDLLQRGRQLHFDLPAFFTALSYPVIQSLDPMYLQPLFEAYQNYQGPELGDQATKLFTLKHVFKIDPKMIKTPLDLLKHLLWRYTH
ncbi:MAG: BREX-3 system phosphatase PglZ, partial [Anaerolineae bacterium]|nr:BREX-3 system phosphatase PglZ [Anaerolineae bacterium]